MESLSTKNSLRHGMIVLSTMLYFPPPPLSLALPISRLSLGLPSDWLVIKILLYCSHFNDE